MILWTSYEESRYKWERFFKQGGTETTKWQFTFPLISCSTMFSGLRSLWMILFLCRYWIPEPGAGEPPVLLRESAERRRSRQGGGKLWTYPRRWLKKVLRSLSGRSSFQACSASGIHVKTTRIYREQPYISCSCVYFYLITVVVYKATLITIYSF